MAWPPKSIQFNFIISMPLPVILLLVRYIHFKLLQFCQAAGRLPFKWLCAVHEHTSLLGVRIAAATSAVFMRALAVLAGFPGYCAAVCMLAHMFQHVCGDTGVRKACNNKHTPPVCLGGSQVFHECTYMRAYLQ